MPTKPKDIKMYNEDQKLRFLSMINKDSYPYRYWELLFTRTGSYESIKDKDLCNFSKPTIREMLQYLNYLSYNSVIVDIINLRRYVDWCMMQGLVVDGMNHFNDCDNEFASTCVNMLQIQNSIVTRDCVLMSIGKLQNVRDQFIILGLFEGIQPDDIVHLELSDFTQMVVPLDYDTVAMHNGYEIKKLNIRVSKQLYLLAEKSASEWNYYNVSGKPLDLCGNKVVKVLRKRYFSGYDWMNHQNLYRVFERCIIAMGWSDRITMNSLRISGAIQMVKDIASALSISDFEVLKSTQMFSIICDRYNIPKFTRKKFYTEYKNVFEYDRVRDAQMLDRTARSIISSEHQHALLRTLLKGGI